MGDIQSKFQVKNNNEAVPDKQLNRNESCSLKALFITVQQSLKKASNRSKCSSWLNC